jgi:hypothetical protein
MSYAAMLVVLTVHFIALPARAQSPFGSALSLDGIDQYYNSRIAGNPACRQFWINPLPAIFARRTPSNAG